MSSSIHSTQWAQTLSLLLSARSTYVDIYVSSMRPNQGAITDAIVQVLICRLVQGTESTNPCEVIRVIRDEDVSWTTSASHYPLVRHIDTESGRRAELRMLLVQGGRHRQAAPLRGW